MKIEASQWNKVTSAGNYYFENKDFKVIPNAFGHEYKYNSYYMNIVSYDYSGKDRIITLYPFGNEVNLPYFETRIYYQNNEQLQGPWRILSPTKTIRNDISKSYNPDLDNDDFKMPGEYYLINNSENDPWIFKYGGNEYKFDRAILEVKGWVGSTGTSTQTTQTLYLNEQHLIFTRTRTTGDWANWKPLYNPEGITLKLSGTDEDETTLKELPSGNYLIKQKTYAIKLDGIEKKYIIPTDAKLSVEYFGPKHCKQTLIFDTDGSLK